MLPTAPAWNQAYTPLSFVLTTLNLGALTTALVMRDRAGPGPYSGDLLGLTLVIVISEIVLALLVAPRHGAFGDRPGPSLRPPAETSGLLHIGRLALLAAGLCFIGMERLAGVFKATIGRGASLSLILAFVLVLASEVVGRFLFYGLLTRPGR
jgi:DMSO reductase anchor subunit